MATRRSPALVALAIVGTAVVAWALNGRGGSDGPPSATPADGLLKPNETAPPLAAPNATNHRGVGSRILGTVRGRSGPGAASIDAALASGVEVEAIPEKGDRISRFPSGGPRTRVRADADGRFTMVGLRPGRYEVVARANDGTRGESIVEVACDGTVVEVQLFLAPTHTLSGRAGFRDGRPFRGEVAATMRDTHRPDDAAWFRAGDDGSFRVVERLAGVCTVWFREPGGPERQMCSPQIPATTPWIVVLDAFDVAVTGTVVDDATGTPIVGATVIVTGKSGPSPSAVHVVETGADGLFVASVPGTSCIHIRAEATTYAPGLASTDLDALDVPTLTLRLRRPTTLTGTVTRQQDATPVAGAVAHVLLDPYLSLGSPVTLAPPCVTDQQGRFRWDDLFPIPWPWPLPQTVEVVVLAPGLAQTHHPHDRADRSPTRVTLELGRALHVDVALDDAAAVQGRVVAHDGTPVEGVVVYPTKGWYDDPVHPARATTQADGTFSLEGLPRNGEFGLVARDRPGARVRAFVGVPANRGPVEIVLPAPRQLRVRVVDAADGAPLPDAEIRMDLQVLARTDAHGRAEFALPHNPPSRRRVRHPGYVDTTLRSVDAAHELEVRMARVTPIIGRVVFAEGGPAPGVTVARSDALGSTVLTDADGAFVLEGVDGGVDSPHSSQSNLRVEAIWRGPQGIWVASTKLDTPTPLTLTLARYRAAEDAAFRVGKATEMVPLTVRVLDSQAQPLTQFGLAASFANAFQETEPRRWPMGIATVWRPRGTKGWLEIRTPIDSWGRRATLAPAFADVEAHQTELEIRLAPTVPCRGRVVEADGRPVSDVLLKMVGWRTWKNQQGFLRFTDKPLAATRSAPDGAFVLEGLSLEDLPCLFVIPGPDFLAPEPLRWTGAAQDVEIRLLRGVRPTLTIVDPDGEPIADAKIEINTLWEGHPRSLSDGRTDVRGLATTDALDPDARYDLEVKAPHPSDLERVRRKAWRPTSERIVLPRPVLVRGQVQGARGEPVAADVSLVTDDDEPPTRVRVEDDGAFEFNARPGPVRLTAHAPGHAPTTIGIEVNAATPPIDVVLRPSHALRLRIAGLQPWPIEVDATQDDADEIAAEVGDDGSVQLAGLDPTRAVTLWGPPARGGHHYLLEHLAGFGPDERPVALRAGGAIRVRIAVPAGRALNTVWAQRGSLWVEGVSVPAGGYEVRGLPPGRWTVRAYLKPTRRETANEWIGSAEGEPGDEVSIEMRRR